MQNYYVFVVAGLLCAGAAQAQDVNGEVKLSYGLIDIDGLNENGNNFQLYGAADFAIAPSVGIQAGAAYDKISYEEDGFEGDIELTSFDLHAFYRIENVKMGGFVSRTNIGDASIDGFGTIDVDTSLTSYGLEGHFPTGPVTLGFLFGRTEVQDFDELNANFVGFNTAIAASSELALLGDFAWTNITIDGFDEEVDAFSFTVGAEYNLIEVANLPMSVTAFVGRTTLDDGEFSENAVTYGLSVSYLFGSDVTARRTRLLSSYVSPI